MQYKKPGGHQVARTSRPVQSQPRQAHSAAHRTTQHDTRGERQGGVSRRLQNDVVEIQSEQRCVHPHAEAVRTPKPDQSQLRHADSAARRTIQRDTCGERDGDVSKGSQNDVVEIQSEQTGGHPQILGMWGRRYLINAMTLTALYARLQQSPNSLNDSQLRDHNFAPRERRFFLVLRNCHELWL